MYTFPHVAQKYWASCEGNCFVASLLAVFFLALLVAAAFAAPLRRLLTIVCKCSSQKRVSVGGSNTDLAAFLTNSSLMIPIDVWNSSFNTTEGGLKRSVRLGAVTFSGCGDLKCPAQKDLHVLHDSPPQGLFSSGTGSGKWVRGGPPGYQHGRLAGLPA